MSPPDDTPLAGRLTRWSAWWFTPRWRALLTWLALTVLTSEVLMPWIEFTELTQRPIRYLSHWLSAPLPQAFGSIAFVLTNSLMYIWFQPSALRLNLLRGLWWIAIRFAAAILLLFISYPSEVPREWVRNTIDLGAAALQCWVLRWWRSRPWMCLLAEAAAMVWTLCLMPRWWIDDPPVWITFSVQELPPAALLLYGTRLLRPEERARGGAGK